MFKEGFYKKDFKDNEPVRRFQEGREGQVQIYPSFKTFRQTGYNKFLRLRENGRIFVITNHSLISAVFILTRISGKKYYGFAEQIMGGRINKTVKNPYFVLS